MRGHSFRLLQKQIEPAGFSRQWFRSAKEVAKELEVSDSYAYRLIRQLNAELEQKGFVVVKGKISRKYFEERVYGMNEMK